MIQRLIKFRPDNFTDHVRTPWAGRRIAQSLKDGLGLNLPPYIGESWEFSTASELPSKCANGFDGTFAEFLNTGDHAENWLSSNHRQVWGKHSPLLVKYIDSEEDLSLQLHPPIESKNLPQDQSGKWESWLVLRNAPQSGIYLGLNPHVTRDMFIDAVYGKRDLKPLLHFVKAYPGELYAIPPCTIHALGGGLCVLEPQLMQPGKKAISLRLHDWNRRYDRHGNHSSTGTARKLHIDEAMEYIDFDAVCGIELEKKCRMTPNILHETSNIRIVEFPQKPWLMARFITGTGSVSQTLPGEMLFVTVMQGSIHILIGDEEYDLKKGESCAIAASNDEMLISCTKARVYMAHCLPAMYPDCAKGKL